MTDLTGATIWMFLARKEASSPRVNTGGCSGEYRSSEYLVLLCGRIAHQGFPVTKTHMASVVRLYLVSGFLVCFRLLHGFVKRVFYGVKRASLLVPKGFVGFYQGSIGVGKAGDSNF